MKTIMRVGESLIKINGYKVNRFDIQHYSHEYGIERYVGYLHVVIDDVEKVVIIHADGSFEWSEH